MKVVFDYAGQDQISRQI